MQQLSSLLAGILIGIFVFAGALYFTNKEKECRVNIHGVGTVTTTYIGVEHEPI